MECDVHIQIWFWKLARPLILSFEGSWQKAVSEKSWFGKREKGESRREKGEGRGRGEKGEGIRSERRGGEERRGKERGTKEREDIPSSRGPKFFHRRNQNNNLWRHMRRNKFWCR
jgi:hypothetical protein